MKNISLAIGLLLFTSMVNSAEIMSRVEKASSQELNVRCDNGKNVTITYRYPNESYAVEGRFFDMYIRAVDFACK